jgi:beta-glucosidase
MARGATFDPGLEERIGDAIGKELRARGANLFGGICVNLLRYPQGGRAQETYGEDPHHVGEMGAALCRGVQRHAMACVKHFALNNQENARFTVDVTADDRVLHEVYLPHFKRIVDEGVACVMSSYNSANGSWCGENHQLLTEILRDEWGFDGFVISDWMFGLRDAVKSVKNGLDIEMPFRQQRSRDLRGALDAGTLTEAEVDAPVSRTIATMLRYDELLSRPAPEESVCASDAHRELAYEAAVKSIVLLKNAGNELPLEGANLKTVAVLGRLAAEPNLGDRGSSNVDPPSCVTPLDGLKAALPNATFVVEDGSDIAAAKRAAESADVAIVVVGCTYEDEGEYISAQPELLMQTAPPRPEMPPRPPREERPASEERPRERRAGFATGGDRQSLDLSEADQALILAAAEANERTIVVLMGGSAIMVEAWHQRVPAIVMLWYPGMEGGRALADVLLGNANPTGRLPFAVPIDAAHLPAFEIDATAVTYDLFHGQWLLDRDRHNARYPFGFGLGYARGTLGGDIRVGRIGNDIVASGTLVNSGGRARKGPLAEKRKEEQLAVSEVVQVYGGFCGAGVPRPEWRLLGFARVDAPEKGSVPFRVVFPVERLAVRIEGEWRVEPGEYEFAVGLQARDPKAHIARVRIS